MILDPSLIAQFQGLRLSPRLAQAAALSGSRNSARLKGTSSEFIDYRLYTPGDDPRRIDWKIYARSDRYHLRSFEGETHSVLRLAVDASRSMTFRSKESLPSKWEAACQAAAALSYLALKNGDACGLNLFSDSLLPESSPPQAAWRSLYQITASLENFKDFRPKTHYRESLAALAENTPKRSLFAVISDFLGEDAASVAASLDALASSRHEVIAIRILDPMEIEFQLPEGSEGARLLNLEEQGIAVTEVERTQIEEEYAKRFRQEEERLETLLAHHAIAILRCRTDQDLGSQLARNLIERGIAERT